MNHTASEHFQPTCFLANGTTLAGHVEIRNKAVIWGLVAVHQFCRIGDLSIIGGCSKVVQDIPPFSMCDGHPASVKGVNLIGLKRAKFSKDEIMAIKKAFHTIFFQKHTFSYAAELLRKDEIASFESVKKCINFVTSSKRGVAR